jgi:hypothetical protein
MCEIEHGQCNDWGEDTTAKEYESKTNTTKKVAQGDLSCLQVICKSPTSKRHVNPHAISTAKRAWLHRLTG